MRTSITRRAALRAAGTLAASGLANLLPPAMRPAAAQGNLASLGPEENVEAALKRLFGGRPIKDGSPVITMDLPLIAENGALVPLTVEVASPQTRESHVKAIYVISDKNRRPLNAKFNLTPASGLAFVGTNLRLGESTDVRAIAEMSDGTLHGAKRQVKVTVGGCGG
jgi:sulfur-oxidizing protein SoxY